MKCIFLVIAIAELLAGAPALMPLPARVKILPGEMRIDGGFRVKVNGFTDARLASAVARFTDRLSAETGVPFFPDLSATVLEVECAAAAPAYPTLGEDEAYRLIVGESGARLTAKTTTGILRGFETVLQLAGPGETGMRVPALDIQDAPRFPWRGLMLDVSRHWMPLPVVLRNLDAMSAVKLNVFHWHLSDDQGFRVESKRFPRLQEQGSDGHFYTQEEIRLAVAYARDRGIRVIPEFDVPGHTTSWFVGYPALAGAPGPYAIERAWGIFQPTMDPSSERTYAFLDEFFGEMAALFPDPYFHIGGDEVEDTQWKNSPAIQAFQRSHGLKTSQELHAYFNTRLQSILKKHGKTLVGWDEILNPGLESSAVIQSWRGAGSLIEAARKGHRAILSGGYYLDHLLPGAKHYLVDPFADTSGLSEAEAGRILGGEACMWSEYVSPETVDSRIWPRLAAIAERFWSPAAVRDIESMSTRLEQVSLRLEYSGIRHRADYLPMLDRIAGWNQGEKLLLLADALEAQGITGRRNERKYSSPVPLNRLVDAARPEAETVAALTRRVRSWLVARDPQGFDEMRRLFASWQANPADLGMAFRQADFLLTEVIPLSKNLAAVGKIGTEALAFLGNRQSPPVGWIQASAHALDTYEQPLSETKLAAVQPVRLLVDALRTAPKQATH